MSRTFIVLLLTLAVTFCRAQGFTFTQNNPGILNQNSGFTGAESDPIIRTTYKGSIGYDMLYASIDAYSYKLHGGLGAYIGQLWSNVNTNIYSSANLVYSPSIKIKDSVFIKPSVQYGFSNYKYDISGAPYNNYQWGSLGAGLTFIYKKSFFGIVMHNVNRPDLGYWFGKINVEKIISIGTLIDFTTDPYMNKRMFLFPSIFYTSQGAYWHYDAGVEFRKSAFLCGARIINYSADGMYYDNVVDYLGLMIGLRFSRLRIAYSRDFSFDNSNNNKNELTLCISFARTNVKGKSSGLFNILL